MAKWTIENVRTGQYPPVWLRVGQRVLPAQLSGRREQFCTVSTDEGHRVQYAWPTVARILNKDSLFSV
jgi:hypothetical protein